MFNDADGVDVFGVVLVFVTDSAVEMGSSSLKTIVDYGNMLPFDLNRKEFLFSIDEHHSMCRLTRIKI